MTEKRREPVWTTPEVGTTDSQISWRGCDSFRRKARRAGLPDIPSQWTKPSRSYMPITPLADQVEVLFAHRSHPTDELIQQPSRQPPALIVRIYHHRHDDQMLALGIMADQLLELFNGQFNPVTGPGVDETDHLFVIFKNHKPLRFLPERLSPMRGRGASRYSDHGNSGPPFSRSCGKKPLYIQMGMSFNKKINVTL